jgi:alkanesulfonate monooxygenase SsuD/methylene tetrahydromethanopterin reductase-like flavin-dependent oxidoreductase (luciferase family)
MGFGLMLSSWTPFAELARQAAIYRKHLDETPEALRANPGRGHVDIARWVYVAETDAKARNDSEAVILRSLAHFSSGHTSGYLGTVSQDVGAKPRDYEALTRDIILHGSPATVVAKIEELRAMAGNSSVMLHFPPWYGAEKALASLELFAGEVIPKFKNRPRAQKIA